jgi:murein DD-endopeptidase MepM/ murein hydrolase activator NlpD
MMYRLSMILGLAALVAACGQRADLAPWSGETAPSTATMAVPATSAPYPNHIRVARGDTLYGIARRYGLPVRSIIDANNLSPPYSLNAGATLTLPQSRQHIVQPGETLERVAVSNGVGVSSLARTNKMAAPYDVRAGQALTLPAPATGLASSRAEPVVAASPLPPTPQQKPRIVAAGAAAAPRIDSDEVPPPDKPVQMAAATSTPLGHEAVAPAPVHTAGNPFMPPSAAPAGRGFVWPLEGRVISGYGAEASGGHNDGINIAAPSGTPVVAAEAGTVAYVGNELRGYGNLVLLKHQDGYLTAYAHNSTVLVHKGDRVARGQTIARVGATGAVKEPQLHFEIRNGRNPVDPAPLLPQMKQASAASS